MVRNVGLTNVDITVTPKADADWRERYMTYAGALVGRSEGIISGCFVTGKVTAPDSGQVGGLVGHVSRGGVIRSSYAMVRVRGMSYVGGLVGRLLGMQEWGASYVIGGEAPASYATGTVLLDETNSDPDREYVGGLLGTGYSAYGSYATGRVGPSGASHSSGLAGGGCTTGCPDSYWDSVTSGIRTDTGSGGAPKTTAELQAPTGYSGIYATWNVDVDGDGTNDDPWDFGTSAQ